MTYEGQFDHGEKKGHGKMTLFRPYQVILGTFGPGTQNNVITYTDSTYKGQTLDCLPHGFGIMSYKNGESYIGGFLEGKENGYGVKTWKNGCYKGLWSYGTPPNNTLAMKFFWDFLGKHFLSPEYCDDDNIRFTDNDGIYYLYEFSYEGGMKEGKFHGKGKLIILRTGDVYEGDFKNGKFHGQGIMRLVYRDITYIGPFANNLFDGKGTIIYEEGKFEGEFKEGMAQGAGEFCHNNGDSFKGFFHNNTPLKGKMIFKNVGEYEGLWNEGIPHVSSRFV